MLTRLYIQNYALIDSLDITLPGNLVVISGETGAGKSILLGALSLLLGRKADSSALGDQSRNCVVEAEFEDAEGGTILRRVVSPQGRSRAFVNDEPVSLDELKEVSSRLIDLHSQFDHTLLTSGRYQLSILDAFASTSEKAGEFSALYDSWTEVKAEIADTEADIEKGRADHDYIEFQFNQLDSAHLAEGEIEELEAEQLQLSNSETISENLSAVDSIFESEESSLTGQMRLIENCLEKVSQFIPEADSLKQRVEAARIEMKDISYEVSSISEKVKFSPERLQEIDDRLALLYDLMRKHGVTTVAQLMDLRDSFSAQLGGSLDLEEKLSELKRREAELQSRCAEEAAALHETRAAAAAVLSSELQESIRSLEMPQAVFTVDVQLSGKITRDGSDLVSFRFSANKGQEPKELSKCASGGELSRIMLCIKALISKYMGMPTVIFDEIDTGVSGSVAYKMGEMIVEMGRNMQVMTITHLPQVASRGNAHFLVYKQVESDGRTHSGIRRIEGEEREREVARMLSGATISEEALANARALMKDTLF